MIRPQVAAEDALRRDEMARIANTARLMVGLSVLGVVLIPLIQVDHVALSVFIAVLISNAIAYGSLLWVSTDPARYSHLRVGICAQLSSISVWGLDYVFGPFSAAPMATVLPLFAYALGASKRWSLASYLHTSAAHLVVGLALGNGWIVDRAVVASTPISPANQLVAHGCIQTVMLFAYLLGRWSRTKTVAALTDLEHAVRQVAERDALLAELHHHLDVAAGIGAAGRFTDHVIGPYRLGELIGRGAMGEVYAARHVDTDAPAAVKMIGRGMVGSRHKISRFLRELEIARKLDAPNVVRVLDVGEPDADLPYLAMEHLHGDDLAELLRQRRSLPPDEVVAMIHQLAAGLDAAHAAGIVHRDLKPSNVFRHEGHTWKILDFGVSKLADSDDLTHNAVIGTPAYMAPEQARGDAADARADVYALAAIAYRALTGAPLYGAGEPAAILYQVVHRMPARPGAHAALPADVDAVLAIGLAKAPEARFATASELATALAAAVHGAIPAALRERAQRLLAHQPWSPGARPRPPAR
ncbi:MAG: serine/threonine protein kinase [Kofleriaceae bacterium]|nr:serine/threonine protein kinase [Kofleriaceae bacterium]MCB9570750.1 serine/threonine protein kinase [Kofleriaceae bacterium]